MQLFPVFSLPVSLLRHICVFMFVSLSVWTDVSAGRAEQHHRWVRQGWARFDRGSEREGWGWRRRGVTEKDAALKRQSSVLFFFYLCVCERQSWAPRCHISQKYSPEWCVTYSIHCSSSGGTLSEVVFLTCTFLADAGMPLFAACLLNSCCTLAPSPQRLYLEK